MVRARCGQCSGSSHDTVSGEDGIPYCGSCWQEWIEHNVCSYTGDVDNRTKPWNSQKGSETLESKKFRETYDDDENVGALEAIVCGTSSSFFLCSRKLGIVFASERTEAGQLRRVGALARPGSDRIVFDDIAPPANEALPYDANPGDHCETPRRAYEDISPVLRWLAKFTNKDLDTLRVYDPYYCAGSVKKHLRSLGVANVYNKCEDFYAKIDCEGTPEYDVLITNPPYIPTAGRDHVKSLLKFASRQQKPFMLLMPNYVYTKEYWGSPGTHPRDGPNPFFLMPPKPRDYVYETPPSLRDVKSSQRKTSPFATFWYCWLGEGAHGPFFHRFATHSSAFPRLQIACCAQVIPDSFKDSSDKSRRKRKLGKRKRTTGLR